MRHGNALPFWRAAGCRGCEIGNTAPVRILVLGPSGAGKSTLSRRLAAQLGIPIIHLDAEYWRPGWVEPDKAGWAARIDELCARDAWIMDGNYSGTLARRLPAADTIVFLDLPRRDCFTGVFTRWWRSRGRVRDDMGAGCPEKFPSPELLLWIWRYQRRSRPKIVALLDAARATKRVIVLRSRSEIDRFEI